MQGFQHADLAINRTRLTAKSVRVQNVAANTLLTNRPPKSTCNLLRRIRNLAHITSTIQHVASPTAHTHGLLYTHHALWLAALEIG